MSNNSCNQTVELLKFRQIHRFGMTWSKVTPEEMRQKLLKYISLERATKPSISLWDSTKSQSDAQVTQWIGTVVNIPRRRWAAKIPPKAQWQLIQEVKRDPRRTSKYLQASLASATVYQCSRLNNKKEGKEGIHERSGNHF